jgi:hypothetical protein
MERRPSTITASIYRSLMLQQKLHDISPIMRSRNMQRRLPSQFRRINLSLRPIRPSQKQLRQAPIPRRTSPMQRRPPKLILSINTINATICAQQQLDNLITPTPSTLLISRKIMQRIPPAMIPRIHIRPAHNQQLQDIHMILPCRRH